MKRLFRYLAWLLLLLVVGLIGYDGFGWAYRGAFVLTDLGSLWWRMHPTSLQLAEPAVARYLHPALWNPVITTVLLTPAALVFAIPGLLLLWASRAREGGRSGSVRRFRR